MSAGACANQTIALCASNGTRRRWRRTPRWARPPSRTATTTWRWPRCPSRAGSTMLLAGANDLWKSECPWPQGCAWRNTTNSTTCLCAQVGEYQHALAWNAANPLEIFVGNDSGLWRSTDADRRDRAGLLGERCHSFSESEREPGFAGRGGEHLPGGRDALHDDGRPGSQRNRRREEHHRADGGLAADSGRRGRAGGHRSDQHRQLVREQPGGSFHLPLFAIEPLHAGGFRRDARWSSDADVGGDGLTMTAPAPFLVDPLDRLAVADRNLPGVARAGQRRGLEPRANAISPILDGGNRQLVLQRRRADSLDGRDGAARGAAAESDLRGHVRLGGWRRDAARPCASAHLQSGHRHGARLDGSDARTRSATTPTR